MAPMDFARRQRDPTRHMIGITIVIIVHILVIYGLVTGLARKAVEVIKKPLNATIVEELKAPPPPPPPPKKIEMPKPPPPPAFVPPPDIQLPTISSENAITMVAPTPPPAPPPPVPAPPPPPPPPAKPAIVKNPGVVSRAELDYPLEAHRKGIEGTIIAHVSVDDKGNPTDVKIVEARPSSVMRYFDRATRDALMQWKFTATGEKYVGEIEITYKLQ